MTLTLTPITGESMGGGLSVGTGLRWQGILKQHTQERRKTWLNKWRGVLLVAPMIAAADIPPAPVIWIIRNIMATFIPMTKMPSAIDPLKGPERSYFQMIDSL